MLTRGVNSRIGARSSAKSTSASRGNVARLLGLNPLDTPLTTFSNGIDTPEITRQKVKEAEAYPILKIKVGLRTGEANIDAVRSVAKKPCGWTPTKDGRRCSKR